MGFVFSFSIGFPVDLSIPVNIWIPFNSGRYFVTSASKSTRPRSTHCMMEIAVMSLVHDAIHMTVSMSRDSEESGFFRERKPMDLAY